MANRVGQQLGNYRLVQLLGQGGFADVYLGEHIHLGTQAAIKVLHTQLTSDDIEPFRNEARTIARLEHLHIVLVFDFGLQGTTPFLVMSYAPNGTLRELHPKGTRLPLASIVSYIKQIAPALQYAHDQKLIHRDIKPENLLVGRNKDILLSDFGIALMTQKQISPTLPAQNRMSAEATLSITEPGRSSSPGAEPGQVDLPITEPKRPTSPFPQPGRSGRLIILVGLVLLIVIVGTGLIYFLKGSTAPPASPNDQWSVFERAGVLLQK